MVKVVLIIFPLLGTNFVIFVGLGFLPVALAILRSLAKDVKFATICVHTFSFTFECIFHQRSAIICIQSFVCALAFNIILKQRIICKFGNIRAYFQSWDEYSRTNINLKFISDYLVLFRDKSVLCLRHSSFHMGSDSHLTEPNSKWQIPKVVPASLRMIGCQQCH